MLAIVEVAQRGYPRGALRWCVLRPAFRCSVRRPRGIWEVSRAQHNTGDAGPVPLRSIGVWQARGAVVPNGTDRPEACGWERLAGSSQVEPRNEARPIGLPEGPLGPGDEGARGVGRGAPLAGCDPTERVPDPGGQSLPGCTLGRLRTSCTTAGLVICAKTVRGPRYGAK